MEPEEDKEREVDSEKEIVPGVEIIGNNEEKNGKKEKDVDTKSKPAKPFEAGGYVSELGEIKLSDIKIPAPKIFTGGCAMDRDSTILKVLKEEGKFGGQSTG